MITKLVITICSAGASYPGIYMFITQSGGEKIFGLLLTIGGIFQASLYLYRDRKRFKRISWEEADHLVNSGWVITLDKVGLGDEPRGSLWCSEFQESLDEFQMISKSLTLIKNKPRLTVEQVEAKYGKVLILEDQEI